MNLLIVEEKKCTKCGLCANVCPIDVIDVKEKGPEIISKVCANCGHCVAVCPEGALSHKNSPFSKQVKIDQFPVINEKQAALFMRSRKSIRCFKEKEVPKTELLQLLDIARFAPTGGNSQGISFLVISDKENIKKMADATAIWMEKQIKAKEPMAGYYLPIIKVYKKGKDNILRNASHIIFAVCNKKLSLGRQNAISMFTYAELFANTIGLGSCWAGFLENCAMANYSPLTELLELNEDQKVVAALMVGYPQYKYPRLVDRNALEVKWI